MPARSRPASGRLRRRLAVGGRVVAVACVLGGCSSSGGDAAPRTTTSSTVVARPATTTTADLARIDPALEHACDLRTADLVDETSGTPPHRVPMMVDALRGARSAVLRDLAAEMAGAESTEVHVQVNQLTRLCVEAGYKIPNGYGDP